EEHDPERADQVPRGRVEEVVHSAEEAGRHSNTRPSTQPAAKVSPTQRASSTAAKTKTPMRSRTLSMVRVVAVTTSGPVPAGRGRAAPPGRAGRECCEAARSADIDLPRRRSGAEAVE